MSALVMRKSRLLALVVATGALMGMHDLGASQQAAPMSTLESAPALAPTVVPGADAADDSGPRADVPVILNEYNAVGSTKWLDCDGDTSHPGDCTYCSPPRTPPCKDDVFFGRVKGNGGNWFELVVTQDHLDMRGWQLYWTEATSPATAGTITLTSHSLWSNLRAGTIITFAESDTAHGGLSTDTSFDPSVGDWWININTLLGDPEDPLNRTPETTYATTVTNKAGDGPGNFSVGNNDWKLTIKNASGITQFGPCGEGMPDHAPGVSSNEVFKLEEDPNPQVDPVTSDYNDGTSSTFGHPNTWSGGDNVQNFGMLRSPGTIVALVARTTFSGGPDETTTLPTSETNFAAGSTYYVEMWAQTLHPTGLTMISADVTYDPAQMVVVDDDIWPFTDGIFHTTLFSTFPSGTVNNTTGLVDDLSGSYLPGVGCANDPTGVEPMWSRVAVLKMQAVSAGAHGVFVSPANDPESTYVIAHCGTGEIDPALVDYRGLNEPSGELVLFVPDAPQQVMQGEQITVQLQIRNLSFAANGVTALMHYNTDNLYLVGIVPSAPWLEIVENNQNGDLCYSAFAPGASVGPGAGPFVVATLTFVALDDGTPVITFLPDYPPSFPTLQNRITEAIHGAPVSPATIPTNNGDIDISPCDDDNACTTDSFDSESRECVFTPLVCNDDNICTDDTCDPAIGCVYTNNTAPCDDNNACTTADACSGGTCVGGPPLDCNDNNVCTDDTCDPASGCAYTNNTDPCNDNNACTENDICAAGTCTGTPISCDDGNACTADTCDTAAGCQHENEPDDTPCPNVYFCDGVETCQSGVCTDGDDPCAAPLVCDEDGNTCVGCLNNSDCDDGLDCTIDTCVLNSCVYTPDNGACSDGNVCTDDTCVVGVGCVHTNNTAPCNDNNACTTADACSEGSCVAGPPLDCNDNNVCTDDTCDPATGCVYTNNMGPCSDGNACTTSDACSGGSCVGGAPLVCDNGQWCDGTETCDPASGCQSGTPPNCNDGLFCTDDTCDELNDVCAHSPYNCDDGDDCTTDTCNEDSDACEYVETSHVDVTMAVQGLSGAVTREVTFVLTDCEGTTQTRVVPVSFSGGQGTALLADLTPGADWIQVYEGHTLARRMPLDFGTGCIASVTLTGNAQLTSGDFSNPPWVPQDDLVDIVDFAILAIYWNDPVDPNLGSLADATGDGLQNGADFTLIQMNFADISDPPDDCGPAPQPGFAEVTQIGQISRPTARLRVSTEVLGVADASAADRDGDGFVDVRDIRLFAQQNNLTLLPAFETKLRRLERLLQSTDNDSHPAIQE